MLPFLLLMQTLVSGCLDLGYEVPPPSDSATTGGATDNASGNADTTGTDSSCVEGPAVPSASGPQVKFAALSVDVSTLTIQAGDTVTWTNADSMPHSVVAGAPGAELATSQGGFSSPDMPTDGKWAFRFCKKRSVFYFCGKHPSQMAGYRVVVQ